MSGLKRVLAVLPQAALVTLLLLVLMVSLIEFSDTSLDEEPRIKLPPILMPPTETEIIPVIEPPIPPLDVLPPPTDRPPIITDGEGPIVGSISTENPKLVPENGDMINNPSMVEGDCLPIVKVAPQYPRRALSRGIEGYVILEYIVTKLGTVRDVKVVESEPPGVFDKAAIKSALRYKYKPRVENGVPIESACASSRITFELDD